MWGFLIEDQKIGPEDGAFQIQDRVGGRRCSSRGRGEMSGVRGGWGWLKSDGGG